MTAKPGQAIVTLIVAAAENGVIGKAGALPWHLSEDLKRFKRLTLGKPCIMGRKTWDSLPRKPLPGRTNIVLTRDPGFVADGAVRAASFTEALAHARAEHPGEIMVIGGEAVFAAALPEAGRIELTEVHAAVDGDAAMPVFDRREWHEVKREGPLFQGALAFSFVTLERHPL
jgi:dihydrofolate reductase